MIDCLYTHHVSLVVRDLPAAKAFYSSVLGLREMKRPAFDFPGAWYAVGEHQQLHLLVHPPAQTIRELGGIDSRDGHFALRIADFWAAVRHLEQLGVEHRVNPNSITGFAQIFLCDPDGNVIELNHPMPV